MAPNTHGNCQCFCSSCISKDETGKSLSRRTVNRHLKKDRETIEMNQSGHSGSYLSPLNLAFYQECESRTSESLAGFAGGLGSEGPADKVYDDDATSHQAVEHARADDMEVDEPEILFQISMDVNNASDLEASASDTEFQQGSDRFSDGSPNANDIDSPTPLFLDLPRDDPELYRVSSDHENDYQGDFVEQLTSFIVLDDVRELHNSLLEGYKAPIAPPSRSPQIYQLSRAEQLSFKHYITWQQTNGTVKAYTLHARNLGAATGENILSLYSVRKLASSITELIPSKVDICPYSCIAFTGKFAHLTACPYIRNKIPCGQARFQTHRAQSKYPRPRAQMMTLPIVATIKAMFANVESSSLLRHRDRCLQKTLDLIALAADKNQRTHTDYQRTYTDFCDSDIQIHLHDQGLFKSSKDVALALSTDGAQLTIQELSDTWVLIIMLLNLPPEIRYHSRNVIHVFATPGPHPPGDIESFCYPLFQEMARASEGIWTWDAVDSSYFLLHAWVVLMLGDMLGSAKFSGMAGHTAVYGDRFSYVKGARSSTKKGAKFQYYPISPVGSTADYNPERILYDLYDLPIRSEEKYWETIQDLGNAQTKAERARIVTKTGVSRMPLAAASPAFIHPSFFPIDPFHLFYENCMAFIWDLWTTTTAGGGVQEIFQISRETTRIFGQTVAEAMSTLPPEFCGPIRDPFLKRNSQYKIYEWMGLLHWYIIPLGIELKLNPQVLGNFAKFSDIVEFAMTIKPRSKQEVENLHMHIAGFLEEFEKIYVDNNPENIARCRLCIFQLIHVPRHIFWNGSIRVGSQATVERAIGELGRKVRSKREPFANLANLIHERELIKILLQYFPELTDPIPEKSTTFAPVHPFAEVKIRRLDHLTGSQYLLHLETLRSSLGWDVQTSGLQRFGKLNFPGGKACLRSQLSETKDKTPARSSHFFEAIDSDTCTPDVPIFGEAIAFYKIDTSGTAKTYVIYRPVVELHTQLQRWQGKWSADLKTLPASKIQAVIGVWNYGTCVHILRKHPGKLPVTCGLFFSLGHSTIVIVVNVAIAISTDVFDKLDHVGRIGGIIGGSVSATFLFIVGLANSMILWKIVKKRRQDKLKQKQRAREGLGEELADENGPTTNRHNQMFLMRIIGPVITFVDRPWKMYPVGLLFGLGFDTASSIAILAISAIAKRGPDGKGIPPRDIVVLPLLFTAGMTLIDSVDSILMLYSYTAFAERSFAIFEKHKTQNDLEEAAEAIAEADVDISSVKVPSIKTAGSQVRDTEDSSEMKIALRVKQNAMSGLSIILTLMSILVAFSISLITIMGLIGENCSHCQKAAEAEDGGGLAGRWWRGWAKANDNSGYIGAAIVGGFLVAVIAWYTARWISKRGRIRV